MRKFIYVISVLLCSFLFSANPTEKWISIQAATEDVHIAHELLPASIENDNEYNCITIMTRVKDRGVVRWKTKLGLRLNRDSLTFVGGTYAVIEAFAYNERGGLKDHGKYDPEDAKWQNIGHFTNAEDVAKLIDLLMKEAKRRCVQ